MSSDAVQQFPNRDALAARRRAASETGPTVHGQGTTRQKTWAEHAADDKLVPDGVVDEGPPAPKGKAKK